jgi:hypothetical protein
MSVVNELGEEVTLVARTRLDDATMRRMRDLAIVRMRIDLGWTWPEIGKFYRITPRYARMRFKQVPAPAKAHALAV